MPGRCYGSMCWFRWEIHSAALLGKEEMTAVVLLKVFVFVDPVLF